MYLIKNTNSTCMKKLFSEINGYLCGISEKSPQGNELKRINSLSGLITGIIRKGKSDLPSIGSGLPREINANSKTVAAKRFIENKWVDYESHYLPFLTKFLPAIIAFTPYDKTLELVIDGSQMGKNNAALMISIVWQNRGIPICWFVKKGSKGHFKEEEHVQVLQEAYNVLSPILPEKMPVVLLGDGEFDGIELQKFCLSSSWDYVLRTACNTVLFENGDRFKARDIEPTDHQHCTFIQDVEFTNERFKSVNFLCWHHTQRHEEPIFLISNLTEAWDIMHFYDKRYAIEGLFKDMKTASFNLHKTRLKKPDEVATLILMAALAFILIISLGMQFNELKWRKKVQRVRCRRKVLSFFSFSYLLIQYLLENDICFKFSLHISKNYADFFPGYT